jgi:hypothetical protein
MRTASLSASDSTKVSRLVVTARDDAFGNAALQIGQYAHLYNCEFLSLLAHPIKEDLDFGCRIELLTEQIAGLYDPKAHEFYIADWIAPEDQRMVMSHELTHALQDQQFQIELWVKAARPNDDAELARESVLEGSAMAGMLDYTLRDKGLKLRELPDIDPSIFVGDLSQTPMLKKAPPFIKDSLMFPYFSGLTFSLSVLKADGWNGFAAVFARPPANTQQILHPELYRAGKVAPPIQLELPPDFAGKPWTLAPWLTIIFLCLASEKPSCSSR